MKAVLRIAAIVLMLLAFLFLVPSGAYVGYAEVVDIAIDQPAEIEPHASGYLSDREYGDPSISVQISESRAYETDCFVTKVKIANPTQLRSYIAGSYHRIYETLGTTLAKRVKAVVTINGDFFTKRPNTGVVIRQGVEYRMPNSDRELAHGDAGQYDVLIIDDQADLHILKSCTKADLDAFAGRIINAFTFGPGLVIDGVKQENFPDMNNGPAVKAQRMAIAQTGPLEYLLICCNGPEQEHSTGMTMDEFADFVFSQGSVINAYNLDGGSSSCLVFNGSKLNGGRKQREIVDILYFVSAWTGD